MAITQSTMQNLGLVVNKVTRRISAWIHGWRLSLFEKVILANSFMLVGEALAGLWVTSNHLETHHYLIDTLFIVIATLLTLGINILILQVSFRPLFSLLRTIRNISAGRTQARAILPRSSWEIGELAQAFNTMLDNLEEAQREQARLILAAQEEERRRVGLELHDEAGQNLTALLIHAEILHHRFQTLAANHLPEQAHTKLNHELQQFTRLTQKTLEDIRVLSQQLRPSVLTDLGLAAAFRWLVEDGGQRLHLDVTLELEPQIQQVIEPLPPAYATALFRIAQESLTNVARHAHARHVTISLVQQEQHLHLQIKDDGSGYSASPHKPGSGILGMRERAQSLGGSLLIKPASEQGTTVQAIIPLPALAQHKIRTELGKRVHA